MTTIETPIPVDIQPGVAEEPIASTGYPLDTMATTLQPLLLPDVVGIGPDSEDVLGIHPVAGASPPPMSAIPGSEKRRLSSHRASDDPAVRVGDNLSPALDDICLLNFEEKQLCMLCPKRFDMDVERDLFLAHLVMDHNVVIADVKHVPYFPGYVEEWRKLFKTLPLDVCPKIKTNYVAQVDGTPMAIVKEAEEEEEAKEDESSSREGITSDASAVDTCLKEDVAEEIQNTQLLPEKAEDAEQDATGGGRQVGAGDEEEEEEAEEGRAASPPKLMPEAGDAPAVDVLRRSIGRPALEVEDPAIAAAHPAVPPLYGRRERSVSNAATSSASLDSMSSTSSILSASNTTAMVTASHGEDYHYLLCDAIPQDYALRHKLQRKRLEYALQRQEAERNDVTFSRLCLFCNAYFEGNRAGLFHHMAEDHNFNVGQPDNIVFSNEFLDTLQSKLDNSICLYCEKDFKDKATLKDHMRKKMHRRIRGSNREYDKFYLINYLELGKSWNDIQSEEDIEIRPGPAAESEWADWTGEGTFSVCLFCSFPSSHAEEIYAHMRTKHGFDLSKIRATLKLSFYQQIKLINFYRRKLHEHICPSCSLAFPDKEATVRHMQEANHTNDVPALVQWDQPQFFFPTYENDHLLSLLEDVDDNPEVAVVQPEDPPDSAIYNSILARKELRHEIIYDSGPVGYKGRAWK